MPRSPSALAIVWLLLLAPFPTSAVAQVEIHRGAQQAFAAFRSSATTISRGLITLQTPEPNAQAWQSLERIERVVETIRGVFGGMKPREKFDRLTVWRIPDRAAYIGGLRVITGVDGSNSGGMFVVRGDDIHVFVHGESWPILLHELWHAVAAVYLGDTAPWIDEGLAEIFERGLFVEGSFVIGAVSGTDVGSIQSALASNMLRPSIEFTTLSDSVWGSRLRHGMDSGSAQYTQAWITLHFLLFADEGAHRRRVNTLLSEINRGRSAQSALHSAIGADAASLGALDAGIARFVRGLKPVDPVATAAMLRAWGEQQRAGADSESHKAASLASSLTNWASKRAGSAGPIDLNRRVRALGKDDAPLENQIIEINPLDGMRWEVAWVKARANPNASAASNTAEESGSRTASPPAKPAPTHEVQIRWFLSRVSEQPIRNRR